MRKKSLKSYFHKYLQCVVHDDHVFCRLQALGNTNKLQQFIDSAVEREENTFFFKRKPNNIDVTWSFTWFLYKSTYFLFQCSEYVINIVGKNSRWQLFVGRLFETSARYRKNNIRRHASTSSKLQGYWYLWPRHHVDTFPSKVVAFVLYVIQVRSTEQYEPNITKDDTINIISNNVPFHVIVV
jgi:NADH:ubiquinone oxidoreductase subunit